MAQETVSDDSRKRKRSQKSRQGPVSSRKRRRANHDAESGAEETSGSEQGDAGINNQPVDQRSPDTSRKASQTLSKSAASTPKGLKLANPEGALPSHSVTPTLTAATRADDKQDLSLKTMEDGWTIRSAVGGRYLSLDPQFTADGNYLVAAKEHEVRLLSLEDSLVQNRIEAPVGSTVTGFAVSPTEPRRVYIGFSNPSRVEQWDWEDATSSTGSASISGSVISVSAAQVETSGEEIVYTLAGGADGNHIVRNGKSVFGTSGRVRDMAVFDNTCVCIGPGRLVVGTLHPDGGQEAMWQLNFDATCLAVRKHTTRPNQKKQNISFDLALGSRTGEIFVYENVIISASGVSSGPLPTPRILHWHRESVRAVKWSRDGNYLISGGRETVLCIWQLATGKRQFLPHLSAEIEQISVSPSGSSYALQLADNSIMVLSTSELKPVAHFPDIQTQLPAIASQKIDEPTPKSARTQDDDYRLAGAVHPVDRDCLLTAVPPSASTTSTSLTRQFLQSFSLSTQRHQYRQALTRNTLTDLNTGPNGLPIQPPDVSLIALTSDGKTMATVESWTPLVHDFAFLSQEEKLSRAAIQIRREVYLKFWNWDATQGRWALQTRISNPHPLESAVPGSALELVSDPTGTRFFTLGSDNTVRVWTPKSSDWVCKQHLTLSTPSNDSPGPATLCISPDASLVAVSIPESSISQIHLLSTSPLSRLCTLPSLPSPIHALVFHARYLIALSTTALHVFDIPTLEKKVEHALRVPAKAPLANRRRHLAVLQGGHIAIASPCLATKKTSRPEFNQDAAGEEREKRQPWTRVEVYHIEKSKRQFETRIRGLVMGLFAKGPDVLAVCSDGRVVEIKAPSSVGKGALDRIRERKVDEVEREEGRFEDGAAVGVEQDPRLAVVGDGDVEMGGGDAQDEDAGDRPVVRPEELASLFEGRGAGMQVRDMFEGVLGLFARRPVRV
ncbi:hypothetical protein CAC42_3260 [Sphaceloma murrayae]|uniref:WD repeat-containing protein 75 second beta-propeller domain-containing protein n=1 Tax=Sphaceloma murrayae TaxID=2082308 RepID=A0A2K1QFF1_9PEZI|nr:hypothetical protein CAC42_3260 [Sphaceloma murrayae]